MTSLDERTPVVVGGGQVSRHDDPLEPIRLVEVAARAAAEDAGAPAILEAVESVRLTQMLSWRYGDPGRLLGGLLGADVRHSVYTGAGGCFPQLLVNAAADDIAAGRLDVALVGGAEAWRTRMARRAAGERPDWTPLADSGGEPDELLPAVAMHDPSELAAGLDRPTLVYPLFEQALAAAHARTSSEQRQQAAALWSRFSAVANGNPHAWLPRRMTTAEIAGPGGGNRLVAWPYSKLMTSNNFVDQGAAVIVCSVAAARRHGVPPDRWVFLRAGAEATDTAAVAARPRLDASAPIAAAGRAVLAAAGVDVDDLGPIDLYSCFPAAVQVAAAALGLPLDDERRPLTVTGGMTFAGGPWNNYSTHAIATLLGEVRRSQRPGLVTANSGYLTKHALGVYAAEPGERFRRIAADPDPAERAPVGVAAGYAGPATIEVWTVSFERDGTPGSAMAALRTPDGERTLAADAVSADVSALLAGDQPAGQRVTVAADASFRLD